MRVLLILLVLAAVLILSAACMPGNERFDAANPTGNPAGFLWGLWHGMIALVSLIVGLFDSDTRIYETSNTVWWYDLGFFLTAAGCGASARGRRRD